MNEDTENDLIGEMNRPDNSCRNCTCSEEAGMCESMGAEWNRTMGEWVPTPQCQAKAKSIKRAKFLKSMSKGFVRP